jgi:SAM-dependent methyltransferase
MMHVITPESSSAAAEPWQLQMFRKTLKKQQKVRLLLRMLGPLSAERCLLLTNGDNNGAMNYVLRAAGGRWTWAEVDAQAIAAMEALLGEQVHRAAADALPFADASFDRIVVIDAHEHLLDVRPLNHELARLLAPGGLLIVTVPNGNPRLPVAALKRLVGMGPAEYGHVVQGYQSHELEDMLRRVDLLPVARGAYSRFFTELAELALNFAYVKVLSRRTRGPELPKGTIAPSSAEQLRAVQKTYRMYALIHPMFKAFSWLDVLVPGRGGYAVAVAARKPA